MTGLPLLLLILCVLLLASSASANARDDDKQAVRREQIARFLETRKHFSPMCLYTFDETSRPSPVLSNSSNTTAVISTSALLSDTTQGVYKNHVASGCPFGSLQFNASLVTTLNSPAHSFQLGVRILEDPMNDTKRIQLASTEFVAAQDFYTPIVTATEPRDKPRNSDSDDDSDDKKKKRTGGVTFEIVLRRHFHQNGDMTLFSIANVYDGCVDPGFRVAINADRMLVLVYYLPMEEVDQRGTCYEQLLVSSFEDTIVKEIASTCRFPEPLPDENDNPPVYIAVTIDPASTKFIWKTEFHMQYTDPITLAKVDCRAPAVMNPPFETRLHRKSITGNLRLFIGNSPRNESSPRVRRKRAPVRKFRPLSSQDMELNATQRLRATLMEKLMSIKGPQIPEAMRILGDKSLSVTLFGVELPPVNEDTPLAYLRGKLRDFLVKNGETMVGHLIDMLRKVQPVIEEPEQSLADKLFDHAVKYQEQLAANGTQLQAYPDAHMSSFDLFHFAIYRNPFTPKELDDGNWTHLGPFRPMPKLSQELKIQEDECVLVDLVQLHSVYDDVQLELRRLPEFGKLLLYPNKTEVTEVTLASFRDLPTEFQKKVFFQPNLDESNENLPLPNTIALSRRRRAYSEIEFSVFKSSTGRKVNESAVAKISIFVSAVNDAPRPLLAEQQVIIDGIGVPVVLELEAKDGDGSPRPPVNTTDDDKDSKKKKKGFLDQITDAFESPFASLAPPPPPQQFVKVTRLPRYGRLYDCHLKTHTNESLQLPLGYDKSRQLEKYRIALDDIANRTFSTSLVYVYGGWGQSPNETGGDLDASSSLPTLAVIDELWYQLNDGEPGVYSDIAVVKFAFNNSVDNASDANCLKIVQLKEDTSIALALAEIEPLVGIIDARTKFRITEFPKHGALYQFHRIETNNSSNSTGNESSSLKLDAEYRVGKKLNSVDRVIDDVNGRLVYIPERDYYNVLPLADESKTALPTSFGMDSFAFEPEDMSRHLGLGGVNQSSAELAIDPPSKALPLPLSALQPRVIQIQVVSEPDELLLLPPTYFVANQSVGESVPTPVHFEDPDALYDGLYQAVVKAKDGFSRFDVGADMNNDDVMKFCNFTRPCLLARSLDKNRTAEQKKLGDESESDDKKLLFFLQHVIHTPYHIVFLSKKKALELALSQLTFTDWKTSWLTPHRAQFTVKIRRISDSYEPLSNESSCKYYVDYPLWAASGFKEMTEKLVHLVMNQMYEFVWTLLISVLICVLITNASCFKSGFCCCCSRARENRRSAFEAQQASFLHRVAQNDYEYSMLLMDVADMVLEPNLAFATSLVRGLQGVKGAGKTGGGGAHLMVFCLRSLIPVLETERQATRFVFLLMVIDFEEQVLGDHRAELSVLQRAFLNESSCAGRALALFCRHIGKDWLRRFMVTPVEDTAPKFEPEAFSVESENDDLFSVLLEKMSLAIVGLPAEIVILCRACVKLLQTETSKSLEPSILLLQAVHLVFFNHFIGPALLYGGEEIFGVAPDRDQRQWLVEIATHFTVLTQRWDANRHNGQQTSGDDYVLLTEVEEKREMSEGPELRQYESLLYTIATSSALQSSYEPSGATQRSKTDAKIKREYCSDAKENSSQVDCELMAMCLMNIHSILDTFLPQFEKERKRLDENLNRAPAADDEHVASLVSRLKNLLRALSFPNTSIHTLLQHGEDELSADWLCSEEIAALPSFSAQDWTEFVTAQHRDSDSYRHHLMMQQQEQDTVDERKTRVFGRSQSLLAVHIEDNMVEL